MIEPVELADFFATFFSAAAVILCGALYALLFAYSRIRNMPRLMPLAYSAYAALFASVIVLGDAANLFGSLFWMSVVMLMLAGYFAAPHAVWHLCVNTHAATHHDVPAVDCGPQPPIPLDCNNPETFQRPCKEEKS